MMLMRGCYGALIAAALLVGCERQPPINRAQAEARADALIAKQGDSWGRAESLVISDENGGRRFWVVRYPGNEIHDPRAVAVNVRSGWTRFLKPGDVLLQTEEPAVARAVVLLIREVAIDDWSDALHQEWSSQAQEWNSAARDSGQTVAYGLRRSAHSWQLVWGWNDGRGLRPDTLERRRLHAAHAGARWIEIDGEVRP